MTQSVLSGRILITGAEGFLGGWALRELPIADGEVVGTFFARRPEIKDRRVRTGLRHLDVTDPSEVDLVVHEVQPSVIFHFAGQAFIKPSWTDPVATFATNFHGTLNLLESVRRFAPGCTFAFAGSGTEYGDPEVIPTPESSPLQPTSPYAASKAAGDLLCYQYFRSYGVRSIRLRIFGTTGPGKRGDSVNDFAQQIVELEKAGHGGTIDVGNLDKQRDVSDVRDAISAIETAVRIGEPGDAYNIGSGVPRTVRDTLNALIGLSRVKIEALTAQSRVRPVDEPIHLADVRKISSLGWRAKKPFEETLENVLDFWRGDSSPE